MGMNISYKVEEYDDVRHEIDGYLRAHWDEIALNQAEIPLDKDEAAYAALNEKGSIHILTVRKDGELVGYIAGIVSPHLHYKSSLHCFTDVFWIRPDCRKGRIGIELFKKYRSTLKARGVKKVFIASKCHLDMSLIFERLGWTRTEVVYSCIP